MTNKLYKVLCRINGKLLSPFQGYETVDQIWFWELANNCVPA